MEALAENAADKPLAPRERRASWADSQHRPKHMRWRDKVAYVEHHHHDSSEASPKVAHEADNNTTAAIARQQRRGSWADTHHRPKHMRWRDKVAYVEHHHSETKASTRTSEDSCESTGDTLDVKSSETHSNKNHSKPHHYSESFTHHVPHITFREKMKFLQGGNKNKDSKHEDQNKAHKWTSSWSARSHSSAQLPPRAPTSSLAKTSQLTSSNNEAVVSSQPLQYSEKRLLGLPYPALAS